MPDQDDMQSLNISVTSPSGNLFFVMTDFEKEYFEDIATRYQKDNIFLNVSDLQDLDRVLIMELMIFRWSQWLSTEFDYFGERIMAEDLKKSVKDYSSELRLLKKALGVDKSSRERDKGESVAAYIENLKKRAGEFGIHRDNQTAKAIEILMELKAYITLFDNCLDDERKENKCDIPDIIAWIRAQMLDFDKLDDAFRKNQKMWVKTL